jgi:G3E family GTPase
MKNIPITIIGGYLGAGKATLINRILTSDTPTANLAVLVNDFGDINLDAQWIKEKSPDGKIIGLTNGCICCTIGDDLSEALENLREQASEHINTSSVEHILLEASGVASPKKLQRQCQYPGYYPRVTFVLVDASRHAKLCQDKFVGYLAKQQVEEADYIILSKQDLAPDFKLSTGEADKVLVDPNILAAHYDGRGPHSSGKKPALSPEKTHDHKHDFTSCTLTQTGRTDLSSVKKLCADLPLEVHRVKGYVTTDQGLQLLQQVGQTLAMEQAEKESEHEINQGYLVFIYLEHKAAQIEQHLKLNWEDWRLG